jgi:hypothetical protein
MTAEQFGERIGEILGKAWPRQTVYLMEQGERRLAAEEVVAIADVLDVSVADLFTPPARVDQVQVGQKRFSRERLLTQGQRDSERLYEVARHTQALRRSMRDIEAAMRAQSLVITNIDNAVQGKPPIELAPEPPEAPGSFDRVFWFGFHRDYERAQAWYEPEPEGTFLPLEDQEGGSK